MREKTNRYFAWPGVLALAVGVSACGTLQDRRYERLASQLVRARSGKQSAKSKAPVLTQGTTLSRGALVRAVLAKNPTLESARQAWRAALAKYPQVKALSDPMVEYSLAPLSIGSNAVRFGQVVGISQRLPWPGKRALAGEVALIDAEAMREHYAHARQELALLASHLYDDYYAVTRSIELNDEHRKLVEHIKATAEAQYRAGRASQQEPLQAEVELSHVIHHDVVLRTRRSVIIARMNGLLHERPESPLPPPPKRLPPGNTDKDRGTKALQKEALKARPELRALQFSIKGRESAVKLAHKNYYPDFGVMTSYNTMWRESDHWWMLGISLNIPFSIGARDAAADQAQAELLQAEAELEGATDFARVDVEQARLGLKEARHVVHLYKKRLLPAARAHIEAARIGYETGRGSFQALIDAERSLRTLELQQVEALAAVGKKRAELSRALGQVPGLSEEGESK